MLGLMYEISLVVPKSKAKMLIILKAKLLSVRESDFRSER